jgi:RHS repeat-associated protein
LNPGTAFFYSYDELSNLTEVHDIAGLDNFVYNGEHNRLLRVRRGGVTVAEYTYDAAGFVTSRDAVPITWTAAGQIAAIGSEASFEWDAIGRPVEVVTPVESVRFLFGGAVEADLAGNPKRLDLGFAEIRLDIADRLYRHTDFRGNVKFVTNQSGSVVTLYRYSGYDLDKIEGSAADTRRFAQGRDLSELFLLGARVYDPFIGRFLSPDPIHQVFDQYSYTIGNPVYFWDPGGLHQQSSTGFGGFIELGGKVHKYQLPHFKAGFYYWTVASSRSVPSLLSGSVPLRVDAQGA